MDVRGYDLASSLAYASLISVVPLIACVTVLGATVFGDPGSGLYRLIRLIVPGLTRELIADIQQLATQARAVSGWASFFFLFTSLRMYFLLESAANALWGTTMRRRPLKRLGVALVVVVLGPVAAGLATSLLLQTGAPLSEFRFSGLLLTCAFLTLLYWIVPVAHVRWGPALAAGFLVGTGVAFLKYELTRGVAALSGISRIYGSISAVVILVLALGIVWTILLLGISFMHALQFRCELLAHDEPEREAHRSGPLDETVRLLSVLADGWHAGRAVPFRMLCEELGRSEADVKARIDQLVEAGLVQTAADAGAQAEAAAKAQVSAAARLGASYAASSDRLRVDEENRAPGTPESRPAGSVPSVPGAARQTPVQQPLVARGAPDDPGEARPASRTARRSGDAEDPAFAADVSARSTTSSAVADVAEEPREISASTGGSAAWGSGVERARPAGLGPSSKHPSMYRLARAPEEISLYTVARALGESVPRAVPMGDDPTSVILRKIYRIADREVRSVLQGTSLRDIARPRREPLRKER